MNKSNKSNVTKKHFKSDPDLLRPSILYFPKKIALTCLMISVILISIKEGNSLQQYSHLVPDWAHSIITYFQKMNLGEVFRPFLKRAWYRVEKFQVWYLWYDICMQIDKVPSQSKGSQRHNISLWQIWQGFCFQKGTTKTHWQCAWS